jgi:hypothetical protein
MPSSRNTLRRYVDATVPVYSEVGDVLKAVPDFLIGLPRNFRESGRERARRIRDSAGLRWLARTVMLLVLLLTAGLWEQAVLHRAARAHDPKLEIPVRGAPSAVVSFSGRVVTASEDGKVSAMDPLRNEIEAEQQLKHSVTGLASYGGWLFASGGGQLTRLSPDLSIDASEPDSASVSILSAGPAGLWAAGDGHFVQRLSSSRLTPTARVDTDGAVAGVAVSTDSVWATVPSRSKLLVISRHAGRFVGRSVSTGCAATPVTLGAGWVWVLCPRESRIVGFAVDDVRRTVTIPVGAKSSLLTAGNHSLYVASATTEAVTQYGLVSRQRVGRPIAVETMPSAIIVDLHAVWVASNIDHSLQRLDLAGLRLQRNEVPKWDTIGKHSPDLYLTFAIALSVLLAWGYQVWRSGDADAGLRRHEYRDITVLACDEPYFEPFSQGRPVETSHSTRHGFALALGSKVSVGSESGRSEIVCDLPRDRVVQHAVDAGKRARRVTRFMGHVPAAGAPGLLRARRRVRLRTSRLWHRYLALEPFTVCWLHGTWNVSRPSENVVYLRLPELIDRDWGRWRHVPITDPEGWITVTFPPTALTTLGRRELDDGVAQLKMTVLAVPSQRSADGVLHMHLVVAYF